MKILILYSGKLPGGQSPVFSRLFYSETPDCIISSNIIHNEYFSYILLQDGEELTEIQPSPLHSINIKLTKLFQSLTSEHPLPITKSSIKLLQQTGNKTYLCYDYTLHDPQKDALSQQIQDQR
jgi:hypothetical protein